MTSLISGVGEMFNYAFNSLDMTSSSNDIIVIQHADGTLHGSPFTIRFGKVKVLRPQDKVVTIEVNGRPTTAIMKIASDGTAYWLRGDGAESGAQESPLDSPMPQSPVVGPESPFNHGGLQPDSMPPVMDTVEIHTPVSSIGAAHRSTAPNSATSTAPRPAPAQGHFPDEPAAPQPPPAARPQQEPLVRLLDEAPPSDLLLNAEPSVGVLLQSLATEAHLHQHGSSSTTEAPAAADGLPTPCSIITSTDVTPGDPSHGDGGGGIGRLRLSRLASSDALDSIAIAHVSLDPAAPVAAHDVPTTAAEYLQQQHDASMAAAPSHVDPHAHLTVESATPPAHGAPPQHDDEFSSSDDDDAVVGSFGSVVSVGGSPRARAESKPGSNPLTASAELGRLSADSSARSGGTRRSLFGSHHDLVRLNLKPGANTIKFSTGTTLRGKVDITANIFLWSETAKLVVSDIDGTVTKSDVMGHIATFFGKDWTHPGLCALYSKIEKNGYHFLYLTARSVSQVAATRQFLFNVEQEGLRLPFGPVLTAPDKLFSALTQELSKKSHEFKITCLAQVRDAFPVGTKPFYAGFGNRIGDVVAYTASEISQHKIFIINKDSVIHIASVKRSYRDLSHMVDETFPARKKDSEYIFDTYDARVRALETSAAADHGHGVATAAGSGFVVPSGGARSPGSDSARSGTAEGGGALSPAAAPAHPTIAHPNATTAPAMDVEAEFNEFNFWRVDPRDLIAAPSSAPAAATSSSPVGGAAATASSSPASPSGVAPAAAAGTDASKRRWQFWKRS